MIHRFRTLTVDDRRSQYHLNIVVVMADDARCNENIQNFQRPK